MFHILQGDFVYILNKRFRTNTSLIFIIDWHTGTLTLYLAVVWNLILFLILKRFCIRQLCYGRNRQQIWQIFTLAPSIFHSLVINKHFLERQKICRKPGLVRVIKHWIEPEREYSSSKMSPSKTSGLSVSWVRNVSMEKWLNL